MGKGKQQASLFRFLDNVQNLKGMAGESRPVLHSAAEWPGPKKQA